MPDSIREKLGSLRERLQSEKFQASQTAAAHFALVFLDAQVPTSGIVEVTPMAVPGAAESGPCSEHQIRSWLTQGRVSLLARCSAEALRPQTADDLRLRGRC
jgi:hypothetical protein